MGKKEQLEELDRQLLEAKNKLKKAKEDSIKAKKLAEKFSCDCGKNFASKRALTLHKKTHAERVKT